MLASWQPVVDRLLRPRRRQLERCLLARDEHLVALRPRIEANERAVNACVRRIEEARAEVFAASDGVVPAKMTALEREWRTLSRASADRGWMDLWARIAPAAWIDRKRWQDTEPALRLDAVVALAADVEGVEAAESAVASLRDALASLGTRIGPRIVWRMQSRDAQHLSAWSSDDARGQPLEHPVRDAVLRVFPDRPLLAADVAHAAYVEPATHEVVQALRALWITGYVLATVETSGMTLEIPPLEPTIVSDHT